MSTSGSPWHSRLALGSSGCSVAAAAVVVATGSRDTVMGSRGGSSGTSRDLTNMRGSRVLSEVDKDMEHHRRDTRADQASRRRMRTMGCPWVMFKPGARLMSHSGTRRHEGAVYCRTYDLDYLAALHALTFQMSIFYVNEMRIYRTLTRFALG